MPADTDPFRKIARHSEKALKEAFEARGAKVVICCDYKVPVINSSTARAIVQHSIV